MRNVQLKDATARQLQPSFDPSGKLSTGGGYSSRLAEFEKRTREMSRTELTSEVASNKDLDFQDTGGWREVIEFGIELCDKKGDFVDHQVLGFDDDLLLDR